MRYKVVPGPEAVTASGDRALQKAANVYQDIIAREASEGWRFVSFDTTTVRQVCCGCISQGNVQIKLLVFEQD